MAQDAKVVLDLTERLLNDLRNDRQETERIGKTKRYLDGRHDLPYAPQGAREEYTAIARKSITNWLPLISNTYAQSLFVDGYRPERSDDNSPAWARWQENGMDARQSVVIRSALDYGVGYGLTLPSTSGSAFMRPLAADRATAWYEDEDDEWPVVGLYDKGKTVDGDALLQTFDDEFVYTVVETRGGLVIRNIDPHGLGVTPLTRFRTRLGADESVGVIWPLIPVQDRINDTVFAIMIALQYASFRQRWATGLAIPRDEDGTPVEPFQAAVDRLWVSDSDLTKFGDFAQTDTTGHGNAYMIAVRTLGALAQISPNVLTGDLINLSAEALAQLRDSTDRQAGEFQTLFGESFEQWLRLASLAAGDRKTAADVAAEIRWRNTAPQSLSAQVDGLGKMVQLLGVPAEAIWEMVPGVTDGDIARWKAAASRPDALALLAATLDRQSTPAPAAPAAPEQAAA